MLVNASKLKKVFGKNINGPITQRNNEFQLTTKPALLPDIINFFKNRNISKLTAISAWSSENDIKIAYHFVTKLGKESIDSKITIITFIQKDSLKINSIKNIYANALIFENEISNRYNIYFED